MKLEIPYVEVYDDLREIVGDPDPGTRFYKVQGHEDDYRKWQEALQEISRLHGVYSPVSVASFVQVSRAAVHKRLKEGRLTGFQFQKVKDENAAAPDKPLLLDGSAACFIPVIECMAWRDIKEGCGPEKLEEYKRKTRLSREIVDYFLGRGPVNDKLSQLLDGKGGEDNE